MDYQLKLNAVVTDNASQALAIMKHSFENVDMVTMSLLYMYMVKLGTSLQTGPAVSATCSKESNKTDLKQHDLQQMKTNEDDENTTG